MDWSYIACFLDTDGYLGINRNLVRIFFVNTNERCLREMQNYMGFGKVRSRLPKSNELGKKKIYKLEINKQRDCETLLRNTFDKMIVKKDKARKCLTFVKRRLKTMRSPRLHPNRCKCGKLISYKSTQCKSCSNHNRANRKKNKNELNGK